MKKISFILIIVLLFSIQTHAQKGLSFELSFGKPTGDIAEVFSYSFHSNFMYLWGVNDNIDLGLNVGSSVFFNNFGSLIFGNSAGTFSPISIAGRYHLKNNFSLGLNVGVAIDVSSNPLYNNGLYLKPLVYYRINERLSLIISYSYIDQSDTRFSSINIGISSRIRLFGLLR